MLCIVKYYTLNIQQQTIRSKNMIFLSYNKEKIEALLTQIPWGVLLCVIKQTECGHLIPL